MTAACRLAGEDVKTMAGRTFGITLSLDNLDSTGIWGLMAQLNYEGAPFEMIGYSAGSAFPKEGFTMHNDWERRPLFVRRVQHYPDKHHLRG